MVIADPLGKIVLVNAVTLSRFGYSRSELVGERVEILIPSSARERHVQLRMDFTAKPLTRTMGRGQPLTAVRKDGSEFPVEIALSPIVLESGTLISSSIRDISDRVTNAKAIVESESRLMLGVEVAGLALAEVDYTTGLNHLTTDAARLFGLAQDFLIVPRETVHAAFHSDDRDELMVRIADSLSPSGRGWFAMDHRVIWPNGEVHWLRVRKQVYFEGDGDERHPVRAVLALFDVTAEKNAAEIVRASGEFVRGVLDSLPEHVVVLDNLGNVLAVNHPSDRHTLESGASLSAATVGFNYLDLCRQSVVKG